jgi:hypothetical protein
MSRSLAMLRAATPAGALALAVVLVLAGTLTLAACGGSGSSEPPTPLTATGSPEAASAGAGSAEPFTTASLVAAFADGGIEVTARRSVGYSVFGAGAHCTELLIDSRAVQVYVLPGRAAAKKAVAGVSADGTSIKGLELYEFIGPEHVFARGRIVVLYVESEPRRIDRPVRARDARVLDVLESLMGPELAGTDAFAAEEILAP